MRNYEDLVKSLRYCAEYDCTTVCPRAGTGNGCITRLKKEAADAIKELLQIMQQLPSWIPVTERLPEENKAVNIVWINRSPVIYYQDIKDKPQSATGVYYKGQWYWWSAVVQDYLAEYGKWECDKMDDAIEVTHWMPLPEPPKEKT